MYNASTLRFQLRNHALAVKAGPAVRHRKKCLLLMGLMMAFAVGAQTVVAQYIKPTPIDNCGYVINAPGDYDVTKALVTNSLTQDCIQIASSGVYLTVQYPVTGPGQTNATNAGIRITSAAAGVQVNITAITIQGFGVGMEGEGSGISIVSLGGSDNPFTVAKNAAQGILINNAKTVLIDGMVSENNGAAGLELSSASGVILQGSPAVSGNAGYGLWIHSSSGNQFFNLDADTNGLDGIYIGEPAATRQIWSPLTRSGTFANTSSAGLGAGTQSVPDTWPPKPCPNCIGVPPGTTTTTSQRNIFVDGGVVQNGAKDGKGAGIVIGSGDTQNVVTLVIGEGNPGSDAVDQNGNCSQNTWTKNYFSSQNPSCIQ
jgi:hypothetical protein